MKYLIKNKDGSVHIMTTISDETRCEDEILKLSPKDRDNVHSHRVIEEHEIPEDRSKRHLWCHLDDKIIIKD